MINVLEQLSARIRRQRFMKIDFLPDHASHSHTHGLQVFCDALVDFISFVPFGHNPLYETTSNQAEKQPAGLIDITACQAPFSQNHFNRKNILGKPCVVVIRTIL
jgi:regulator of sigma D